jgi:hypothetical protein
MYVKDVVVCHSRQWTMLDISQVMYDIMIDHANICKIHTSRLTTLVCNEVICSCSFTKILAFLSMKLDLLSPLLVRLNMSLFQKIKTPTIETHLFVTFRTDQNPITTITVIGFFCSTFWPKTKIETLLVYTRRVVPSPLSFSLSSHRHSCIY